MREEIEIDDLYPLMAEVIKNGGTFRFYPRGESMQPMLYAGRDSVELGAAEDISVGDVVFYKRDDGAYVLHRIVGVYKGLYIMCGDHQNVLEYGIRPEQVLAKLVGYYTGEEYHSIYDKDYKKYTSARLRRFPFYLKNPKIRAALSKLKHIIIK